jgi:hypothetical protein
MGWRLLLFRARRLRRGISVALAVLAVTMVAATGWQHRLQQEFQLTIQVTDAEFVSAVEVHAPGQRWAAAVSLASPSATFVLERGDYTITAGPSSIGYQQHWAYVPTTIHVDGDQTIRIHGTYGHG